jgi:hypothetical protein
MSSPWAVQIPPKNNIETASTYDFKAFISFPSEMPDGRYRKKTYIIIINCSAK